MIPLDENPGVIRFSSRLIPLASHPAFQKVDFVRLLVPKLREIGQIVRENGMRVGFHPEHFTVLKFTASGSVPYLCERSDLPYPHIARDGAG